MSLISVYQQMTERDPIDSLKEEVRGVLRDYRNFWDVHAELIQNAVDAINRRWRMMNDTTYYLYNEFRQMFPGYQDSAYRGKIEIVMDVANNSITVSDNGTGLQNSSMVSVLLPRFSEKKMKHDYGFKGYGLTFAAFISRAFKMQSMAFKDDKAFGYEVHNIFDWIAFEDRSFPAFTEPSEIDSAEMNGWNTIITVRFDEDYQRKFDAVAALDLCKDLVTLPEHMDRIDYLLRTRTAIGNTRRLFSKPPIVPIDVTLKVKFGNGTEKEQEIEYAYWHPKDHGEISVHSYEFANYAQQASTASFERGFRGLHHQIPGHTVGSRTPVKCDILVSAISSTRLGNIESDIGITDYAVHGVGLDCGIYLAIDGMPTGIRLDSWQSKGGCKR